MIIYDNEFNIELLLNILIMSDAINQVYTITIQTSVVEFVFFRIKFVKLVMFKSSSNNKLWLHLDGLVGFF
jgi:hypothetical protein